MTVLQQYGFIVHLTQDYINCSFDAVKILLHTVYLLHAVCDQKHSICLRAYVLRLIIIHRGPRAHYCLVNRISRSILETSFSGIFEYTTTD